MGLAAGEMLLSAFLFLSSWLLLLVAAGGALSRCNFMAMYNFGDSNSDTGGISAAFEPIKAPYGDTFFKKPSGRCCDGRLLIDFIAESLNLPYLSAYLNSIAPDFRHGANFATAGSTVRRQNETIYAYGISPFDLGMQIVQFDQFKSRTAELYYRVKNTPGELKLPKSEEYARALYTFDIGQDDLSIGFRKLSTDQLRAALPDIIEKLADAVKSIYELGGRSFWIHNTGPFGCLPVNLFFYVSYPPPGILDEVGCVKAQNEMAMEFNAKLKDRVVKLRAELPEAAVTYVDMYAAKYSLIRNSVKEGFGDPLKPCCGNHVNYTHVWCGCKMKINDTVIYGGVCKKPLRSVNWDGVHYSEGANSWLLKHIQNGLFTDPPIPITQACHRQ